MSFMSFASIGGSGWLKGSATTRLYYSVSPFEVTLAFHSDHFSVPIASVHRRMSSAATGPQGATRASA
jgi:hypothetical protein